jgi:hypothetical protein
MPLFRGFRGKKGSKLAKILVIVLAVTFVGGLLYTGTVIVTNPTQAGEIMATVNGRAITRAAFEQGYTNAVLSEYQIRLIPRINDYSFFSRFTSDDIAIGPQRTYT